MFSGSTSSHADVHEPTSSFIAAQAHETWGALCCGRGAFAYTTAAFKEALRLYPTAPTLMRRLEADTRLGRTALRKRDVVGVAVYSMHRNPAYWQVSGLWHLTTCRSRPA